MADEPEIGPDHGERRDEQSTPAKRTPRKPAAKADAPARRKPAAKVDAPAPRKSTGRKASGGAAATLSRAVEPVTGALSDAGEAISDGGAAVAGAARKAATRTRRAASNAGKTVAAAPAKGRRAARTGVKKAGQAARSRTATTLGVAAAGLVAGFALNLGRKAAVQAPSALAGDWFDAVKAEHKLALTLFDGLQKTADTDAGKRSTLLTQLKHALGKHAFMEENVLYPALREHGDKEDADKLNHEHGYVKQYLYELENLDKRSPAFLTKVAEFRSEIEEHIREEEDSIFPPLHAKLGADNNAKLTVQANKEAFKLA